MAALDYLFEQEFTEFLMSQQKISGTFSESLDSTQLISATSEGRLVKRLSGILMEKLQRLKQFFFPSDENVQGYIFQARCRDRGIGMGSLKNLNVVKLTKYGLRFNLNCLTTQPGA